MGSYHTPFSSYLMMGIGSLNHKVGYPKKGVWYEPTGRVEQPYLIPDTYSLAQVK